MNEIWKDIQGYEGTYQVSNFGNIRSLDRIRLYARKGKVLNMTKDRNGYSRVFLFKNKTTITHQVHRIVAKHFIPNPDNKPEVNHIDGHKSNNIVTNLEWNTRSENVIHAIKVLKRKIGLSRFGKSNPAARPVICIDTNEFFDCATDAARILKVSSEKICMVCKGHRKSTGGLKFKYA